MTPDPAPFSITAFVPLSGNSEKLWSRDGNAVLPERPDILLEQIQPSCWIDLPTELCPEGGIELTFQNVDDFSPEALLARFPDLPHLQENQPSPTQDLSSPSLDTLLSMVDIGAEKETRKENDGEPSCLDSRLKILELIFRNPQFKTLESTWLGLQLICSHMTDSSKITLSVIPVHPDNLEAALTHHRQSLISNPPDLLLFDSPISSSAASLTRLDFLVDYADNLMTPGLAWLGPSFFNLDSWKELDRLSFLPHTLDNPEFGQFRKIRSLPGSSWLCLCCNRVLGRDAYTAYPLAGSLSFSEPELPWISPVWAIAALLAERICTAGLPTRITGRRNRIRIPAVATGHGPAGMVTETVFPEERIDQFSRCGIVPIVTSAHEDSVFITDTTMLAGNSSLGLQFLTAGLIHLVLSLHDCQDSETSTFNLAPRLSEDIGRHLRERYHTDPGKIKVSVEGSSSIQGTPLRVSWTPSEKILPAAQPIEFHFLWNPE